MRQPPGGGKGQPMPWLSQWFIDWRNEEAAAYFVGAIVNATFLEGVDGTFTDDSQGGGQSQSQSQSRTETMHTHTRARAHTAQANTRWSAP